MSDRPKISQGKNAEAANRTSLIWVLLALWLAYSAGMLWRLKENSPWNQSMCVTPTASQY